MRALYLAIICTVFFISCETNSTFNTNLITFVPEEASTIIKTNNIEDFKSSIANNALIQEFSATNSYAFFKKQFASLSVFKPDGETLFCISQDKSDSLQLTLITKYNATLFQFDSLNLPKQETTAFKSNAITKSKFNNNTFYSTIIDSVFIGSTSKLIIENRLSVPIKTSKLSKIYKTTDNGKSFSIIVNSDFTKAISPFFTSDSLPINRVTKYMALDADITQDQILLNGITKAPDSANYLINIFKNTTPQENKIAEITPANSDGFLSITFQNFDNLHANLIAFNKQETPETTLFDNISEIGIIYHNNNRAVVLNSIDDLATNEALLDSQEITETFRQIDIKRFEHPDWFSSFFHPLIKTTSASFYCTLDNYYVFSNSLEELENIISSYQNKTTFSEREYFKTISADLSQASSLLLVGNQNKLSELLTANFKTADSINTSAFKLSAIQYIYDHDFAHVNAVIKKAKGKIIENSVSEELNIKLDAKLLNAPQFVTNHITKEKEIVVQDVNNNLYLISNKGKVLWKKELNEPILGEISQIDMYKNGRLQLAFTTAHHLYILDRNGKEVAPFPLKFKDNITQPLAVFDYDNNKKYRLLIVQGSNVLMYDTSGKTVKGFNFKKAEEDIIHTPQHFRVKGKDFLTFKTKNKLYILSRTGEIRVTPNTAFTYSSEPVFLYNNAFTTTTDKGDLILIETNGKVGSENLNLGEAHHIEATTKSLVTQSANKLTIRNKTLELDFGTYTPAKLFYLNNKIYISTTDLQAQKVYVFDSQGEAISNFPVYGNSTIDLANLDKDHPLELVTKGNDNAIIIYQIN